MTKIFFIDESLDRMGGVERIINTLTTNLIDNYDIELISLLKSNKETYYKYDDRIKINYIYDRSKLLSKKFKKVKLLYYFFRAFEKIEEKISLKRGVKKYSRRVNKNDIVVYGRVETALEFLPCIKETKKTICREAVHYHYHKDKEKIEDLFPNKVDLFILSSEESIKTYRKILGKKVRLEKIYNPLGITPKIINNLNSKNVVSVGRYDTHKGYDYLIRSWLTVKEKYPDWHLRIVGDGYYKDKIIDLIKTLGLENEVLLIPPTKDIVSELNKASIYVMSSRFEGYANALVEAMSCGLPCISYNWLMGVEEIIKDGENGIVVPLSDRMRYFKSLEIIEEDINNLSSAIIKLIDDKKLREKFNKEAPKIVHSRNKDKIIEKWLEIIKED